MKFGKKPARPGAVRLQFSSVVTADKLPTPPAVFTHGRDVHNWGMFGNDSVGDCVFAGAAHEHMLWTRGSSSFVAANALADYSAVTGYVPGDENTDQGTDMADAAKYRRKTGVVDHGGQRHRVAAYMALEPKNWDQMILAAWLFGAVGVGFDVPEDLEEQFHARQPWDETGKEQQIVGGHYVPVVGRNSKGLAVCVTWGAIQGMTRAFYEKYNDETYAYFSPEYVDTNRLSPEGFDAEQLGNFLKGINNVGH